MDITRAFSFVFEDEDWAGKLVMVVVWAFVSVIPLIGLIGWAALAGYSIQMLRNMRQGEARPLPRWEDLGARIADGANVLIAAFVYNLGNLLMACGLALLLPAMGINGNMDSASAASAAVLAISCCVSLLLLAYNLVIWPMLAVGAILYSRAGQIGAFFDFGRIWGIIQRQPGITVQWMLFSFLASIVLGLINAIPCIGWLAGLALTVPVQGHLLGQFALRLEDKPKNKPKRMPVQR